MALFRTINAPEPLPPIAGDGVILRTPQMADFAVWSRSVLAEQGIEGQVMIAYLNGNPAAMAVDGLARYLSRKQMDPGNEARSTIAGA